MGGGQRGLSHTCTMHQKCFPFCHEDIGGTSEIAEERQSETPSPEGTAVIDSWNCKGPLNHAILITDRSQLSPARLTENSIRGPQPYNYGAAETYDVGTESHSHDFSNDHPCRLKIQTPGAAAIELWKCSTQP
jgi:hypothetical protein